MLKQLQSTFKTLKKFGFIYSKGTNTGIDVDIIQGSKTK